MSGIARLPEDLLCYVLILSAGSGVAEKFAVAQVSTHWRHIALTAPLLWTNFCLRAPMDCSRLPLLLERCGSSSLLEIEVSGSAFPTTDTAILLEEAMHALEPYAERIRMLSTVAPSDALTNVGLYFPALRTLRVRAQRTGGRFLAPRIRLSAPNLRILELATVRPERFTDLLSPELEKLHVENCPGIEEADLEAVLTRCVWLADLTFHLVDQRIDVPDFDQDTLARAPPLRDLRTLSLHLPLPLLFSVLNHAVHPDSPLSATHLSLPIIPDSEDIMDLWSTLLRRAGPLAELDIEAEHSFRLRDTAGRAFSMEFRRFGRAYWVCTWPFLSQAFRAHETLSELTMPMSLWHELAVNFAAYPPAALVKLRVRMRWEHIDDLEHHRALPGSVLDPLTEVTFPRLRRVEIDFIDSEPGAVTRLLSTLSAAYILEPIISNAGKVDVDIGAQISEETRALLESEGHGRWRILERM